jgi:hypothetical protein
MQIPLNNAKSPITGTQRQLTGEKPANAGTQIPVTNEKPIRNPGKPHKTGKNAPCQPRQGRHREYAAPTELAILGRWGSTKMSRLTALELVM